MTTKHRSPLGAQPSVKAKANKTEKDLARELGGHAVPASGAIDGFKGDVTTDKFLIDSKETASKSLMISSTMLNKICKEAREAGKRPALHLKLGQAALGTSREWMCIPIQDFKELVNDRDT